MPEIKPEIETFAKIKVVGVGGSGGSAVNRMISARIKGIEFITINTDVQALHQSQAKHKLHIGQTTTRGLGAGMDPLVGMQSAQENINEIRDLLKGSDMVFVTCGLGGGTGTGASPVVAAVARELGALVVGVVTKPFKFEGSQRSKIAERGLQELRENVDTIITIPNDRILQIVDKKTPLLDAFKTVDDILRQGVQGISEIITVPSLINVDFADVKAVMRGTGSALMGIGEASGENRAMTAAKMAISSPLLDISIEGAKGVLFIIVGGPSMTMNEVYEAANIITESSDPDAKIIFGAAIDENLKDKLRITVVATGFGDGINNIQSLSEVPRYTVNKAFIKKSIEDMDVVSEIKREVREERVPVEEKIVSRFNQESRNAISDNPPAFQAKVNQPVSQPVRPQAQVSQRPQPERIDPVVEDDEEDIEIPTFLRRKMKS